MKGTIRKKKKLSMNNKIKYPNYITLGIDPGSSTGAVAIIKDGVLSIHGINGKTEHQLEDVFAEVKFDVGLDTKLFAVIEKVSAMPGQGVSSMFKFGMNYGFLRACLVANHISFRDFIPRLWQKHYSMSKKKAETKKGWKIRLQGVAENLYPEDKIPLYAADAVLLAHFAKDILINKQ